jgi:ribulose-phosphate 3-epimerase
VKIIPAILTDSRAVATKQIELANSDDRIELVQLDIIDGWYADNLTLTPADFAELGFGQLQTDFHLMTEEPLDYVFELLEYRDHLPIRAVIAQIERMSSQPTFIDQVKKTGWLVGFSLDLFTPVESIQSTELEELDIVQLMSIEAGFQGQEFEMSILNKVRELEQIKKNKGFKFEIIVDGGIKQEQLKLLRQADVFAVTVGSGLWQAADFSQTLDRLLTTS